MCGGEYMWEHGCGGNVSGSPRQRSQRMRDLLETVYQSPTGVLYLALVRAACRQWIVDVKTARSYVRGLVDAGMVAHDPPGGPLHITPVGERWLDADTVQPPADQLQIVGRRSSPRPEEVNTHGTNE